MLHCAQSIYTDQVITRDGQWLHGVIDHDEMKAVDNQAPDTAVKSLLAAM